MSKNHANISDSYGRADVTAAILFNQRGEKLGAPWFLTIGFNLILKTWQYIRKSAEKTHKQREYVEESSFFFLDSFM